jgi:hypothetical protein
VAAGQRALTGGRCAANVLYREHAPGARDDAADSQFLIPGCAFDARQPRFVQ